MKFILPFTIMLLCLLVIPSKTINAQVPLKPLYEEFTSTGFLGNQFLNDETNPIFNVNQSTHSLIKYPVDEDPYSTTEATLRQAYYDVQINPAIYANGAEFYQYPGFGFIENVFSQIKYDSILNGMTFMEIGITNAVIDENMMISVTANITALTDYNEGLRAYIAIVEKETLGNGFPGGVESTRNALLKMLPSSGGVGLPTLTDGQSESVTVSYNMNETFVEEPNDLVAIAFVQDDSDKSIVQSEAIDVISNVEVYAADIIVKDTNGNFIENAVVYLGNVLTESTDVSGNVTFDEVFEREYNYRVKARGFLDAFGTFTISNSDLTAEVILERPTYYYYEPFSFVTEGNWEYTFPQSDQSVVNYDESTEAIYFLRWEQSVETIRLTTAPISFADFEGGDIKYKLGFANLNGLDNPMVEFGIQTTPSNGGPTSFAPLSINEVPQIQNFSEFTSNIDFLANEVSEVKFYWSFLSQGEDTWFYLDDIIVEESNISSSLSIENQISVKVFPNPTEGKLFIETSSIIDEIKIIDINGRELKKEQPATQTHQLDLDYLLPGIYILSVESEASYSTQKITITK